MPTGGVKLVALRGDINPPTAWKNIGIVSKLYIYPLKSAAFIPVQEMEAGITAGFSGFMTDRQFMVTDMTGKMITSRRYPNMVLIKPEVTEKEIRLQYSGKSDICVPIQTGGEEVTCNVWGDSCNGRDLGEAAGRWLSEVILEKPQGLRLVFHPSGVSSRPDKEDNSYLAPLKKAGDKPYFADGFPYLLLSKPSVDQLNTNLENSGADLQVEETRFRPNIFVEGDFPPYAEDQWSYIRIGEKVVFRNVQPCSRCIFTTVDPGTGQKNQKGQPLKTLREYRCSEDTVERKEYGLSPFFGINLGVENTGTIRLGDSVQIKL